jgi:hypothetical protein
MAVITSSIVVSQEKTVLLRGGFFLALRHPVPEPKLYITSLLWHYLNMTQSSGGEGAPNLPTTTDESAVSREAPFSLLWLQAVDPRTFTPYTWENGRETTIRLRAADGSISVNVHRVVSHYPADNEIELRDEVYALKPGKTEAGDQEISQFGYKFDTAGGLTDFDPALSLTERMQGVVTALSGLVTIPDSTITASNHRVGEESNFTSDGTQWIEARSGVAAPAYPAITVGRLALVTEPRLRN